jgi:hypothetical protein
MIPEFEREKTVHDLDRAATVIGVVPLDAIYSDLLAALLDIAQIKIRKVKLTYMKHSTESVLTDRLLLHEQNLHRSEIKIQNITREITSIESNPS